MIENNLVVKSNYLINAQGKLSTIEQKLYLTAIAMISMDDEDFKEYVFPLSEVKKLFNTDPTNARRDIEKAVRSLTTAYVEFKNKQGDLVMTTLLSSARFLKSDTDIILRIDPNLKPELIQLKENFTAYRLMNAYKLDSGHSIRIYELLMQYLKIGKRTFTVEDLKKILGLENKYKDIDNFDRKVLQKAKKEINERTDLEIAYKKLKKGTTIYAIEFHVKTKDYMRTEEDEYNENTGLADKIRNKIVLSKTFSDSQVIELYEIAAQMTDDLHHIDRFEYLERNYLEVLEKKPVHLFAYLKKALQNDFADACEKKAYEMGLYEH